MTSSKQLGEWRAEWGIAPGPVVPLPIAAVAPAVETDGPVPELVEAVKELQRRRYQR